jgi:hypothetical protein
MKRIPKFVGAFIFMSLLGSAGLAQNKSDVVITGPPPLKVAQTFVASTGSDSGSCAQLSPCRTLAFAAGITAPGGEVFALDSAIYGSTVTIPAGISIIAAPGAFAQIDVTSGDGIDIEAGGSDTVLLRGITVNNQGSSGSGIVYKSGAVLHVENCIVSGFTNGTTDGNGLQVSGNGLVDVKDSTFRGNDQNIAVQPYSGGVTVLVDRCRVEASPTHNGLVATDGSKVTVHDTIASANAQNGFLVASLSSRSADMNLADCVSSNNMGNGIGVLALGSGTVTARVAGCTVTDNDGVGLYNQGSTPEASLLTLKNSTVQGNGSGNTSGTITSYSGQ